MCGATRVLRRTPLPARDRVPLPRCDPAKQIQARPLAPAIGRTGTAQSVDASSFEPEGDQADEKYAEDDEADSTAHPRHRTFDRQGETRAGAVALFFDQSRFRRLARRRIRSVRCWSQG